jgi:hypothetical protein
MGIRVRAAVGSLLALAASASCSSTPKMPSGPPPEYEEPPRPSWLKEGGVTAAPPSPLDMILEAPSPPPAPASDAGPPPS